MHLLLAQLFSYLQHYLYTCTGIFLPARFAVSWIFFLLYVGNFPWVAAFYCAGREKLKIARARTINNLLTPHLCQSCVHQRRGFFAMQLHNAQKKCHLGGKIRKKEKGKRERGRSRRREGRLSIRHLFLSSQRERFLLFSLTHSLDQQVAAILRFQNLVLYSLSHDSDA